jgi:hypothetical protein
MSYSSALIRCDEVAGSRYFPSGDKKTIDRGANHTYSTTTIFYFFDIKDILR